MVQETHVARQGFPKQGARVASLCLAVIFTIGAKIITLHFFESISPIM